MTAIKSFTSLEQSRKLAEFLLIESADMCYEVGEDLDGYITKTIYTPLMHTPYNDDYIPCWSLAALLSVLPKGTRFLKSTTDDTYHCDCPKGNIDKWFDNPVDACYEMVCWLKKNHKI
jgi:hypothetical protein